MSEAKAWRKTATKFFSEGDWRGLIGLVALTGYITLLAFQVPDVEPLGLLVGLVIGWYFGAKHIFPNIAAGEVWRRREILSPINWRPWVGGSYDFLETIISEIKGYVALPELFQLKLDVMGSRSTLVTKLTSAIDVAEQAAVSSKESEDEARMLSWYRTVGYLSSILDGILTNVRKDELIHRICLLEEAVGELREKDR